MNGKNSVESEARKLHEQAVYTIEYLREKESNLTQTFYKIIHPEGQLNINVNLDVSSNLEAITVKFLYVIPLCFLLIFLILLMIFFICKWKTRHEENYLDDKSGQEEDYY